MTTLSEPCWKHDSEHAAISVPFVTVDTTADADRKESQKQNEKVDVRGAMVLSNTLVSFL